MVSLTPSSAVSILLLVGLHGIFIKKREITSPSTVLRCGIALEVCSLVNGWVVVGVACQVTGDNISCSSFSVPRLVKLPALRPNPNGIVQNERTHNSNGSWISEFRIIHRLDPYLPHQIPDPGPQTQTSIPSSISNLNPISHPGMIFVKFPRLRSPSSDYVSHHNDEYFHLPSLPSVPSSRQRPWLLVIRSLMPF